MNNEITGAEIVLKSLAEQGVEVVFGYPGGAVLPIYDTLFKQNSIKHVLVRQEGGAIHAAEGYARSTGKTGVVLVTSGPGATNVVTGLTDAMMDSVPIVCITGQVPQHLIGSDAFQECDTTGITRPCTKHNYLVKDVNKLSSVFHEAFTIAQNGRPGPVLIDIPKDVQFASGTYEEKNKIIIPSHRLFEPSPDFEKNKIEEDTGLHALDTHRSREDFEKRQVSEFNPYNESVKNRVLLQKIPIFMSLNSEDLDEIAENAERLHFEKDDYIIKQNDSGDSLYVINDGVVSVYLDNENKDKVFLAKLGVGDFVGEGSLLTGEPRSANVIAETPCIVIKVSKDIIKDIFSKNPNVYDYVANILAQRKLKLDKKKNESQLTKDENKNLVNDIKNAIINFLK